ncbi:MAG: hypothetical protein ACI33K_08015 [Clostridiaceae bacterium]
MIDFTQYTPEELALLALDIAIILSKGKEVDELSVMSSLLLVISDNLSLIASQKANLNSIIEKTQEAPPDNNNNKKEPL